MLRRYRILIVDDHPIVRQGYAQLIGGQPDLEVCGTAESEHEAVTKLKSTKPDVAIVDVTLRDGNGIELVKRISMLYPRTKILVISAHDEKLYAERALEAGALGYLNKQVATDQLIEAIRKVRESEVYVSDEMTRRILCQRIGRNAVDAPSAMNQLTDRELQVFEMIGSGRTTRQIADALHLSPKTIERYKENVKRKLDIPNATQLVQHATRWVLEDG